MSIKENSHILLKLPNSETKIAHLVPNTLISLQRYGQFNSNELINRKFGYTYEVLPDKTIKQAEDLTNQSENLGGITEQTMLGDKIDYLGTNNLSMDEIEQLKKQGLNGSEIILKITNAHQDFQKKTEFSKFKYLNRKKMKYLSLITPVEINATVMLNFYFAKEPSRVHNMGEESLAMMLSLLNVRPGGHYLVVDETPSVLVLAILERLGSNGSVTILHESEHPNVDALKYFDFDLKDEGDVNNKMVKTCNLLEFLHPEETPQFIEKDTNLMKSNTKQQYMRQLFREQQRQWVLNMKRNGFDGLAIVSSLDHVELVENLVDSVAGSAPIVVYAEHKERSVELTLSLKNDLRVLAPTITETKLRRYQTLPGRMHPLMTSKAVGGYILSGIRVYNCEQVVALGGAVNKKRARTNERSELGSSEVNTNASEASIGVNKRSKPINVSEASVDVNTN